MIHFNGIENYLCGKTKFGVVPSRVDIDLTNVCNQDCFYCNSADFRGKYTVGGSTECYIDLIDKLSAWDNNTGSIREIVFTGGGEPTVHKDYHKVIEHCIDKNFTVQMITNGSKLHKLVDSLPEEKIKKIKWIGVDIDSAIPETYESIRRSLTKRSLFSRVKETVKKATKRGFTVDIKSLLMARNTSDVELQALFKFVKDTGANKLHIRPFCDYENNNVFEVTPQMQEKIENYSEEFNVPYTLNLARSEPRRYTKCHQMFLYPIFASNGELYVCCEGRGQKKFVLGNWMKNDVRDLWFSQKHKEIYAKTDVSLCPPCTPNKWNNKIQDLIDNNV